LARGLRLQLRADLANPVDQVALFVPLIVEPGESFFFALSGAVEFGDAFGVIRSGDGLAFQRADLDRVLRDTACGVFNLRRDRSLTDGDFGAGRIERADRLVG
jgi:hypothetical protein